MELFFLRVVLRGVSKQSPPPKARCLGRRRDFSNILIIFGPVFVRMVDSEYSDIRASVGTNDFLGDFVVYLQ